MLSHEELLAAVPQALRSVDVPGWGEKDSGKVRDIYRRDGQRLLITTDRVSAFDRVLGAIPYKGQVLNQLSAWWFEQLSDIVANHVIAVPDPNVTLAHEAAPLPVEVIVRGYITGVTKTSLWYLYDQGDREPYGIPLPDGLQKNDALPSPIITPTTKAEKGGHDERLTRAEILARQIVPTALWEEIEAVALAVFARGQAVAQAAGLILVDTKYEFGLVNGRLTLIDEVHTPDSSRYWIADTFDASGEPANFDKEFLRKWFAAQGYRGDGEAPQMPADFVAQVAARYIAAYEKLTGRVFVPGEMPANARIVRNVASQLSR
ncbi:MAG: phosphoribosylaminoimidazolesuccinocarboxamide synthase [Ardenticatenaceae bacterium]|nr:phosphoribosylaminoimidazolesuccinocarboxamide synthase [Ardenticatenaceae bacterium]